MSWNYRVIHFKTAESEWHAIHEVHYDDDKPKSYSAAPAAVMTDEDDVAGNLKWQLDAFARAIAEPALKDTDFEVEG